MRHRKTAIPLFSNMKLFVPFSQHQSISAIRHTGGCHSSQTFTIMVLEFPPRESCSRRVSLEFLYGTCVLLPSTRAEMTFPNVDRERLILVASFRRWPVAPVLPCLSDPWRVRRTKNYYRETVKTKGKRNIKFQLYSAPFTKHMWNAKFLDLFFSEISKNCDFVFVRPWTLTARSTRCSFPMHTCWFPSRPFSLRSMVMVKMACERELCSFMFVAPTDPERRRRSTPGCLFSPFY